MFRLCICQYVLPIAINRFFLVHLMVSCALHIPVRVCVVYPPSTFFLPDGRIETDLRHRICDPPLVMQRT
jgi:hypothetical protein